MNCEDTTKVVIRYHLWSKLYLEEAVFKENFEEAVELDDARVREEQPLILSLIHAADCCFAVLSLHHQSSAQAEEAALPRVIHFPRDAESVSPHPLPSPASLSLSLSLSLSATHTPFTMQAKAYMEICNARRP